MGGEQVRMEQGPFPGRRDLFRGIFQINTTGFRRRKRGFKRTVLPGGGTGALYVGKMPDTTLARARETGWIAGGEGLSFGNSAENLFGNIPRFSRLAIRYRLQSLSIQ